MREGFAGYGYETAGGDRVTALRDMFDGGGAGRSGEEFEGGGILSLIANLLASPYGSERERTAGIIDQPTRPPRTRPSPPPQTDGDMTAAEALMSREANLPGPIPGGGPTLYDYYRQGGPGGIDAVRTPLQTAAGPTVEERTYQQAVSILNDPTASLEMKQRAQQTLQTLQRMSSFNAAVPR